MSTVSKSSLWQINLRTFEKLVISSNSECMKQVYNKVETHICYKQSLYDINKLFVMRLWFVTTLLQMTSCSLEANRYVVDPQIDIISTEWVR